MLYTLIFFIKKAEAISQNAAIEFFKSKQDCNCYVTTERYKSYAHLFYTRVKPGGKEKRQDLHWLKHGDIDKDVFFVAKIHKTDDLERMENIELLYEKNGYSFWVRKAGDEGNKEIGK